MDIKPEVVERPWLRETPSRQKKTVTAIVLFLVLALVSLRDNVRGCVLRIVGGTLPRPYDKDNFSWADIEPSRTLRWHDCFGDLDCARLDLPMDWQDPNLGERVVIAVARLRAANRSDYRGPVFFNPGGPGGSGVWALRDRGRQLQAVVGDNHDIVSFDPRGIGASVPRIECWDSAQSRRLWELGEVEVVDAHPGVLYDAVARATAYTRQCEARLERSGILHHSSTPYHARDMLAILDQMGEAGLKYWGFSYGTVLGGTFASLYPDRVERIVSDGNVDYNEWFFGSHINFLRDTDNVMDAFYRFCYLAGPSRCALYAPSADQVAARLDALLAAVKVRPVIVAARPAAAGGPEMPEIISYSRVQRLVSTMLYQPVRMFARTAEVLAALESGDGRPLYEYYISPTEGASALCALETVPPTEPPGPGTEEAESEGTDDAFPAIMCSDLVGAGGETVEELGRYAAELRQISQAAGAVLFLFRLACAGRTVRPRWRVETPFNAVRTAFPVLFVANGADNVTPLVSARNNSAAFPDSALLVVRGAYGHTSLAAPSTCAAGHIRAYFQDGILPDAEAVCEPDVAPFDLEGVSQASGIGNTDELSRAVHDLAQHASWGLFEPPKI